MADDTDEVLELDSELEIVEDDEDAEQGPDEGEAGEEAEEVYDFGEQAEAAPASESSVIRDLRKALREKDKRLAAFERSNQPQPVEIGPKPSLETCGYDEDAFEVELLNWNQRKAQADTQAKEQQEREANKAKEWQEREQAYQADKRTIRDPKFAEAEEEVMSALPESHVALIMLTDKPAALISALSRNPDQLETLSKLDLARAAMTIGELKVKLQMKPRQSASPERRISGNAGFAGGTDKQLDKLRAKAEQSGDYTAYYAAKRKANA